MDSAAGQRLLSTLRQRGVPEDVAAACGVLFSSEAEALEHVGTSADVGNGFKQPWKGAAVQQAAGARELGPPRRLTSAPAQSLPTGRAEYYSLRWHRMYYVNDVTGANQWDMPKPLQLQQWVLDAGLYSVDVALARTLFK